ncbi:hypothetical protein Ancab_007909 [Ancistrocladus abbreviatus]
MAVGKPTKSSMVVGKGRGIESRARQQVFRLMIGYPTWGRDSLRTCSCWQLFLSLLLLCWHLMPPSLFLLDSPVTIEGRKKRKEKKGTKTLPNTRTYAEVVAMNTSSEKKMLARRPLQRYIAEHHEEIGWSTSGEKLIWNSRQNQVIMHGSSIAFLEKFHPWRWWQGLDKML